MSPAAAIAAAASRAWSAGAERGGLLVVAVDVGELGGAASPGKSGSSARRCRQPRPRGARARGRPSSSTRFVGGRADAAVAHDAHADDRRSRSASAGAPRPGEAREARALGVDDASALVAARRGERALGEVERAAHDGARRPGRSRNRAGAAPWRDVRVLARLALAAVRQPVEHPFVRAADRVERAPEDAASCPCTSRRAASGRACRRLISHATCVPNWKLRRLSSIDQLLFVSR